MSGRIMARNDEQAEFIKVLGSFGGQHQTWQIWADFITCAACSISNAVDKEYFNEREKLYMDCIRKYSEREKNELLPRLLAITVNALEAEPDQDFLGDLYMKLELSSHWRGQFFTPYNVSKMMALMQISEKGVTTQIETKGTMTVNDCCCGGGAMLIAAANAAKLALKDTNYNWQNHILFTAQDIDGIVAKMCYIQLSLLGCAGYVKIGNSLLNPMTENDDLNDYWFTPTYFSSIWVYRRFFKQLGENLPVIAPTEETECANICLHCYYYYFYG